MYIRATTLGILAAIAAGLSVPSAPTFTLQSTGAVHLRAAGNEAQYGVVPQAIRGGPILMVSLGARASGALQLIRLGHRLPAPGRYPIRSSWDEVGSDTASFHASFMPGTAKHPLGWFHGESGWVTITKAQEGRIAGAFEVRARGFTRDDTADENLWVTVRGSFDAGGDSTVGTIASGAGRRDGGTAGQ
jgi:hypothetical protein